LAARAQSPLPTGLGLAAPGPSIANNIAVFKGAFRQEILVF